MAETDDGLTPKIGQSRNQDTKTFVLGQGNVIGKERVLEFFHARCVILKMSVYSLVIAREYSKGIRDAQSRNEK